MDISDAVDVQALSDRVEAHSGHEWRPGKWGSRLLRNTDWTALVDNRQLLVGDDQYPISGITSVRESGGLIWSRVLVENDGRPNVMLGGFPKRQASTFVELLRAVCVLHATERLQDLLQMAARSRDRWQALIARQCWLTRSEVDRFITGCPANRPNSDLNAFMDREFTRAAMAYLSPDATQLLTFLHGRDALSEYESRNARFMASELVRYATYFDTVEKNPLTDEQREAVVTFDENVMTVAAAGSGKTSIMVAKAGYAIESGQFRPEEILLLAFNRDAAEELAERVQTFLGPRVEGADRIKVATFHSIGLSIIGEATGVKPSVAPWMDSGLELREMVDIVEALSENQAFAKQWDLFKTVYATPLPPFGTKEEPEYWDPNTGTRGFLTIRGETVKSQDERMIANWLAQHGIDYEYERPYDWPEDAEDNTKYHPDFYYPSADVYHEHFGVDQNGNPPDWFKPGYQESMQWKRRLHETYGTTMIETTSYSIRQPDGFSRLHADLERSGVKFDGRPLTDQERALLVADAALLRTFRTFMAHTKSNRLSMDDLRRRAQSKRSDQPDRDRLFLDIFEAIWSEWDRRLQAGNYVDFEDMLVMATNHLAADQCHMPYRLIMADEFQDSSRVRGALLKELSKADDARLFVVGDDWQAVNRFAGADISLMRDFGKIFGASSTTRLTKTFRCPQDLCNIAGAFVSKNPFQIKKAVYSTNTRSLPSVLCFKIADMGAQNALIRSHIGRLADKLRAEGETATAYILGRYRTDCPRDLEQIKTEVADVVDLMFSTIHRAKGLEADYIFLVNVVEAVRGMPSKIADDATLWIAMPEGEDFPFAEERRLFYVALTRAKKMVSMYTDVRRRSEFIVELERDSASIEIRYDSEEGEMLSQLRECPVCDNGVLITKQGQFGPFTGCSRFPRCDFTENIVRRCPECKEGTLVLKDGRYGKFVACNRFPQCKYIEDRGNRPQHH